VRHDGMNLLKRLEQVGEIAQADRNRWSARIRERTDERVAAIDAMLAQEEREILAF
jgi:ribosome recycling factor